MNRGARRERSTPRAIVLGHVDLFRPLVMAGIPCLLAASQDSPLRWSRHVEGLLPWIDAFTDPDGLVDLVEAVARSEASPPVVYYENDAQLLALSRQRARLAGLVRMAIAPADLVESLIDKSRFAALVAARGLPVPASRMLDPSDDQPAVAGLAFPAIVKPVSRTEPWSSGDPRAKATLVRSPEELRALWPTWRTAGVSLLVQELVEGPESRIESYHAYLSSNGSVVAEFAGRKIRTLPPAFGHTTALEVADTPDVIALGRRVCEALAVVGPVKVDLKRAVDGSLLLLEVNPRYNLWHHPGAVAGFNLPALAWQELTGLDVERRAVQLPVRWWNRSDLEAARAAGLGFWAWVRWAAAAEVKSGLAVDDPMPLVRIVARAAGRAARSVLSAAARAAGRNRQL